MKGLRVFAFLLGSSLLLFGCGSTTGSGGSSRTGGGTGGTENSASVDGTVSVPRSTTTNVSLGLSASSPSVSKGSSLSGSSTSEDSSSSETSQIIVTKATTDDLSTSGSCVLFTPSGTVLNSGCSYASGKLNTGTCGIDCSKLDSTKQVECKCTSTDSKVVSILFDTTITSCTNGFSVSAGTLDASSTTLHLLTLNGLDSNCTPDNKTATCLSKIAGDADLKKMLAALKEQLSLGTSTGTLGSGNANQAVYSIFKAFREGIANISGFDFSKMRKEMEGGFPESKGFVDASKDWSAIGSVGPRASGAFYNFFADSTTNERWNTSEKLSALGRTLGESDYDALQSCITNPANCRSAYNQYVDGGSSALEKMAQAGKGIAKFVQNCGGQSLASGHFDAMKKLFDEMDFKSATSKDKLGASVCSQVKAANTDAELTNLRNNPGQYAGAIIKDPNALASDDGTIAQQWINQVGTGGGLTSLTPCILDTQCVSGQTCSTLTHWCVASATGSGDARGEGGAACSANADCKSNSCVGNICTFGTFGLKLFGMTCTNTAECVNGLSCSSGTCGFGVQAAACGNSVCESGETAASCPGDCITTLVSNLSRPIDLKCDATECVYAEVSGTDGKICKVSVNGSPATCIATGLNATGVGNPGSPIFVGSNICWGIYVQQLADSGIFCKARTGVGNTTTVVNNVPGTANMVSDGTNFYWGNAVDPIGIIHQVAVGGGSVSNLATGLIYPTRPILNGTTIFFIHDLVGGDSAIDGLKISRVATSGGSVTELVQAPVSVGQLASDGTNLYWTEGIFGQNNFAVKYVPVGGGSVTTLASSLQLASDIRVSGGFVYFGGQISQSQAGVLKIPVTGGSPTVHASYTGGQIVDIDIVGDTLYYIERVGFPPNFTGTLKKVPK